MDNSSAEGLREALEQIRDYQGVFMDGPHTDAIEMQRIARKAIINTPETADFMAGVPIEATHQRERWGSEHDAGKTPEDWFWLIGYLAQKALRAQNAGDVEKAKHHTISTAAALANWHAALTGANTSIRPESSHPIERLS